MLAGGTYLWNEPKFVELGVVAFVLAVVFAFLRFLLPRIQFRSLKRFRDPYELIFAEDGIKFRSADINSELKWSLYHRAFITPAVYLLYYEKRHFTAVPQRVFKSEEERQRFDKLISEKIPSIMRRTR